MVFTKQLPASFEMGPIRPPSEAYSLLIRVTRNCPWNRCRFCRSYKGGKFELRPTADIKRDIMTARAIRDEIVEMAGKYSRGNRAEDAARMVLNSPPNEAYYNVALWLHAGGESAFLQDANSLILKTGELAAIIKFLKQTLPSIKRVTSYARSKTLAKKTVEELTELRRAGLSRIHTGLETGYDPLLQYMDKGTTAAEHITGGKKVVAAGISLSEYVILGLGGKKLWREHATATAQVLNKINPDFIRIRTLAVNRRTALYNEIASGNFVRASDEEIVAEERLLLENLECRATYVSDHITNLLQELEGEFPRDKEQLLGIIDRFQSLPPEERANFTLGRRAGIYVYLDDLNDLRRHQMVEHIRQQLGQDGDRVDDRTIQNLTQGMI